MVLASAHFHRIRYLVSKAGCFAARGHRLIIGPHHPSMVFLRDTIRVSGIPREALLGEARLSELIEEARNAVDTILQLASVERVLRLVRRRRRWSKPSWRHEGAPSGVLRCEGEYGLKDWPSASLPTCEQA